MPQDAVDDAGIHNKGDDAHASAAGAKQRIRLEDLFNQLSPRAAGFPGAIRIVPLGKSLIGQVGAFAISGGHGNPPAVGVGPICLKREDAAGAHIFCAEQSLKGFQYRGIGGLGQQAQQGSFALEQAAQYAWNGKGPVTVGYGSEDLARKFFCKEDGAFGLAAGAEIPCPTRVGQKMLLATFVTANSGEPTLKPPAGKELFDRTHHHRAQRPRARLEALFVSPDIAVKVSLKQLMESRAFGMPWTVLGRRFRNNPAAGKPVRTNKCFIRARNKCDCRKREKHGGQ